eukprot:6467465-Amphidinium_carterae.1
MIGPKSPKLFEAQADDSTRVADATGMVNLMLHAMAPSPKSSCARWVCQEDRSGTDAPTLSTLRG